MLKRQSLSPTALFRTTLTQTITLDKRLILLGSNHLLSYFEKNSSLVGVNFGLCIYVSMYVCMYVCIFLCIGLCHTNQIEATILPWKVIHQ